METPELPGPLLREGKVEPGSVPNARLCRPGSSTDKSKCSSVPSPSPHAPACPMVRGPLLLQPRGALASLGPQLRGVCHQPQGEDTGPGPQGVLEAVGALCACSPPCPAPLESPLRGAAPRPMEEASGSADAAWAPSLRARRSGSGWGVPPRSAKLWSPGLLLERWIHRCEGVSALGMRAGDGATQLGDPVCWPPETGVQMGLPALS